MIKYEITTELHLKNIIAESREVAQALTEFADNLEQIEKKYAEPQGSEEDKGKLSWLGKNCKDCGNEKCKKLGTLPKGHDCALWQPKVENHSIKMVTNAKEAETYPISEDTSKSIEEINKLLFENGQAESEET